MPPDYSNPNTLYDYVLERLPVSLPHEEIDDNIDLTSITAEALTSLANLSEDAFAKQPVWRDSLALTGTFRTFYSAARIVLVWNELISLRGTSIELDPVSTFVTRIRGSSACWITVNFKFETTELPWTINFGSLALIPTSEGGFKIWMITTVVDQLKGCPNVDHFMPCTTKTRQDEANEIEAGTPYFDTVVVGAGQAGLSTAGRFKAVGISCLVVDRMEKIGDNWRLRYDSTRLHTTREFAHLPFGRTFPASYPEYLTKDDVAQGFTHWVEKYDINVWLCTSLETGSWHAENQMYDLTLDRGGCRVKVTCRHVVMATGGYGLKMLYPQYENRDQFKGTVLHSEEYKNSSEWKGQNGVVVGSANTAHDIAADMFKAGLKSVYLVQRERTFVIPATHFKRFADALYNPNTPTDVADRISYSPPWAVSRLYNQAILHPLASQEPERYEALEKVGFRVTQYGDMVYNLSVRRGGHYMDVGCSDLIAKSHIKVKSGALPVSYTSDGLICSDGTFLPADVVIFATGFSGSLTDIVASIFGQDVATNLGAFWGLDEEGEIRGAFKSTGQPGMWCAAGTLGHCRWHSRFIALHIRAQLDGHPFPVYLK